MAAVEFAARILIAVRIGHCATRYRSPNSYSCRGRRSPARSKRYDHPYNCRMRAFRRCAPVRMRQIRPVVALSVTPLEGKDQTKTIERAVLLTAFAVDTQNARAKARRRKRPEAACAPARRGATPDHDSNRETDRSASIVQPQDYLHSSTAVWHLFPYEF